MDIQVFSLGPLSTNCFLLSHEGKAVVVDAGGDPARVVAHIKNNSLELTHILTTHLHCDHIYGNKALQYATGAPILANPEDEFLMQTEVGGGGLMGLPMVDTFTYEPLAAGETSFMGLNCTVLHTPGHTPGSLSFYFPEAGAVFTGDLLFRRSIGRTDFPGGDMEALLASVRGKIFSLPEETVVYSGHTPPTTVGEEKHHNPFLGVFQP